MIVYSYEKKINTRRLVDSVNSSEITEKISRITAIDASFDIAFEAELDASQKEMLNNIVQDHISEKMPHFKINEFAREGKIESLYDVPYDLDFKTMLKIKPVKKKLPKNFGKPTKVEYYEKFENNQYVNILAEIEFDLEYQGNFIHYRNLPLRWYLSDGSLSKEFKNIGGPVTDMEDKINEGETRRKSIVNTLQMPILSALIETLPTLPSETANEKQARLLIVGREFLAFYKSSFDFYIGHSDKAVIEKIRIDSEEKHDWLNNSVPSWGNTKIRDYIISQLTF